jgi:hypothetical protein
MNVVLFTGHRIDSPGRTHPRFPAEAEPIAHAAIREFLNEEKSKGPLTGLSGGANGGDILFLEACRELGIPFQMLLALPEDEFIRKSVEAPAGHWTQRFRALAAVSKPRVMANQTKDGLWARNNKWMVESALAFAPEDFVLLALWDGQSGDGPGGAADMVNVAQQHGARFVHLDTRKLFIRTARP